MRSIARIVLLVFIMSIIFTFSFAVIASAEGYDDPAQNVNEDNAVLGDTAKSGIISLIGAVLKYVKMIGSIVAVVILAFFGIQWFMANPQTKAQLKEKAWGYVIGALLVFGGAQIMGWIADAVANGIT